MPSCAVKFIFVLRRWAAVHGVGLYVGKKLLLLFPLYPSVFVGIFFQDVKEKRILSDASKPPEFIKKLLMQTPFNKSCLNFLGKKIMLCFSVPVLILYIRIVMMIIPFHRLP